MGIEVLQPGLWTSIQDCGRVGYGEYGVPRSGTMDEYTAKFANLLVGNYKSAAVMEITQLGPKLKFHENTIIAVTGLGAEVFLNDKNVRINEAFRVEKSSILDIKNVSRGNRIYLSVFSGFKTKKVLNSRSMFDGITPRSKVKKGDFLEIVAFSGNEQNHFSSVRFEEELYFSDQLQVFAGPEFSFVSERIKNALFQHKFTVSSESGRMAYMLKEKIKNELNPILTGAVLPGTVELTPSGQLILFMRDAPITGGYPRILQLSEESINRLSQKRSGEKIRFEPIENK